MSQLWRRTTDDGQRNVKIELFWNRIRNYCHQNWWYFCHLKTHQFYQINKIFTKIGDKKTTKSEGIIVIRIGDIFVTQKLTNFFKSPKFNRKFKSPKHSPKLVKILAKIHWKMNVVSYLWDHIDFLQNCHQFWWFSSIFANFCDFFIEIYSDSLKLSPQLVTKKNPKSKKIIFTRNGDIFVT